MTEVEVREIVLRELRASDLNTLVRQLQSQLHGTRVVWGRVSNSGAVSSGTGFTATKIATGEYRVTFDPPFADIPAVVGSPMTGTVNSKTWQHDTEATTASAFRCSVRQSTDGVVKDVGFHFIATGPA